MFIKSKPEELQGYFADASNLAGGHAAGVLFPETTEEVAEALAVAGRTRTHVTVAGAGTGVVGGRVPFGGIVLATDRLNRIGEIVSEDGGGRGRAEAGVVLADFRRAVESHGLLYPPDPTEWSCFLGGTVATNASGARTFKYGATRAYVRRLKIALATGDILDLARGDARADARGRIRIPLAGGRSVEARLPSYRMPHTRKHAAGYFVEPGVDAIDLFVGSEGTLGVITEVEVSLLPQPEGLLSGIVFFGREEELLAFVRDARAASLRTRSEQTTLTVDARALEYFDRESLEFLRAKYPSIPAGAAGAVFFEQETTRAGEETHTAAWLALLERHAALLESSWFATGARDQERLREFRHALPVLVNEWLARHGQRKVSTDIAVPDESFAEMLGFYRDALMASRLRFVIFGHVGDNHVHVNILPRDDAEAARARELYLTFVRHAVSLGGTISAEHGVGKLKRDYLRELYGERRLREMAALKRAFDPACILSRGNIFAEELL
ncbi:MAG TPA: FAD-linked oxidase C-terminal domain-containing protein [Pyrinomonadaceae bacterium]|jgi:D-lactate dehydrogenase (cytochrome)|nr:FAD-linked oxidase C-terminal domain-containing protein [Pyrinomonadaceae bacterium]